MQRWLTLPDREGLPYMIHHIRCPIPPRTLVVFSSFLSTQSFLVVSGAAIDLNPCWQKFGSLVSSGSIG